MSYQLKPKQMYKNSIKKIGLPIWYIPKILLIMRLIILFTMTMVMQVSAKGYSQTVTLNATNASLNSVMSDISKQTGFDFLYDRELVAMAKPINIQVKNGKLTDVLNSCFYNQPITYKIQNGAILLQRRTGNSALSISNNSNKPIDVHGRILDENGSPLAGATVNVKTTARVVVTDNEGRFSLTNVNDDAVLVITFLGYQSQEVKVRSNIGTLQMTPVTGTLKEVTVSTGYQTLPKERSTGSFEKVDNQLFNRITGTDVLSRLQGTVPGIYFNNSTTLNAISIRGLSTLSSELAPLIVLDNIPYDGDINNINPNDVLDVTILKDAAAASIWGTRAGNGVIVIRTKRGMFDKPIEVSLNTNYSHSKKPDLFYSPEISSTEFVDVENFLFDNGFYDDKLITTDPFVPFVTPVVSLLAKQRAGTISPENAAAQISMLRNHDVRDDFLKYIYREPGNQQYALNVNGGGKDILYYLSAGFDRNLGTIVNSDYSRLSLRSNIDFKPVKNLVIQTGILYTKTKSNNIADESVLGYNSGLLRSIYPYARLADDNGNALAVGQVYDTDFLDNLSTNPKLLDWRYRPLDERDKSRGTGNAQDILLNVGAKYTLNPVFSAEVRYQYQRSQTFNNSIFQSDSFYARDLINKYTTPANYTDPVTGADASYIRNIPLGGIYNSSNGINTNQTIRAQLNAEKNWGGKHAVVALAGAEIRKAYGQFDNEGRRYGYDTELKNFQAVNYQSTQFPLFFGGVDYIPWEATLNDNDNRFTSYFANASYSYLDRYTFSASTRKDASNVFGVNANKRGTPLWSAGGAWNISKEPFYRSEILPSLKLRTTFGYSGTIVSGTPAFAVVTHDINVTTLLPVVTAQNLPNPDLRWEKTGTLNLGLDFGFKNNRLGGSIEYFQKRSVDLLAPAPLDPTTGFYRQTLNTANLQGRGVDLSLNSINVMANRFAWNTTFNFSYNKMVVKKYLLKEASSIVFFTSGGSIINPVEGEDAYILYAFPSTGLDPETGDPRGYLNGEISKDYTAIFNQPLSAAKKMGSSRPRYYGSLRNTFSYGQLSLSANILYKLGYVFRRSGINYTNLFFANTGNEEFSMRWRNPGDENTTSVPSMRYPYDSNRDLFYTLSDVLVDKGDQIRLQDITASYNFKRVRGLRNLRLYGNVSNMGLIWRANKHNLDPDVATYGYPNPLTFALGLNATF